MVFSTSSKWLPGVGGGMGAGEIKGHGGRESFHCMSFHTFKIFLNPECGIPVKGGRENLESFLFACSIKSKSIS